MRPPSPVPGTLRQVDIVLFGDAADQRAGAHAVLLATLGGLLHRSLLLPLQTFFLIGRQIGGNVLRSFRSFRSWWRRSCRLLGAGAVASSSWLRRLSGCRCAGCRGPSSAIVPTTVLTCTVAPACTLMSCKVPRSGRGNFGVNLVGRDLEQRFVALYFLSRLLQPLGNGSFKNRFPHLGHDYICRHSFLPRDLLTRNWHCSKPSIIIAPRCFYHERAALTTVLIRTLPRVQFDTRNARPRRSAIPGRTIRPSGKSANAREPRMGCAKLGEMIASVSTTVAAHGASRKSKRSESRIPVSYYLLAATRCRTPFKASASRYSAWPARLCSTRCSAIPCF